MIVHSGGVDGGQYYAFIRPELDGRWYKFDDDRVTPATEREVLNDNYGGPASVIQVPKGTERSRTAYMLVYIRASEAEQILAPLSIHDILGILVRSSPFPVMRKELTWGLQERRTNA